MLLCFSLSPCLAESPKISNSNPPNGSIVVPVDIGKIVISFDQEMKMNSWSLVESDKGEFPPMIDQAEPFKNPKTFEIRIKKLKPGTTYAIQLNSQTRKGFLSARDQIPLPVTAIVFKTAAGEAGYNSRIIPMSDKERKGGEAFLSLYKEQHQGAFYMLIPKGWKTQGGMIPSGIDWNVVDLVENNIQFRATSPDGKSFFGWYPRFYFQDPSIAARNSMGYIQPQIGGVLNGCWLFPYMNLMQYVQYIVLGRLSAQEFQNPRILGAGSSPELRPLIPQTTSRSECGFVNFECSIQGIPMAGRIYSIIYEIQGIIWSTVGTFGWVCPKSQLKDAERIMEICIRSFRLDPQWVRKAAAGERYRGQKFNEVIREMQRIDSEIAENRSRTRSDIQEEFYKVITWQIETIDHQTGKKAWLPLYNNAWTNGRGDYFLRDYDDGTLPVEDPREWRKLKIINRNDPSYRPEKYGD
jgi:hypothetical protein